MPTIQSYIYKFLLIISSKAPSTDNQGSETFKYLLITSSFWNTCKILLKVFFFSLLHKSERISWSMELSGSLLEGQPWTNTQFCKDPIKMHSLPNLRTLDYKQHPAVRPMKIPPSNCDSDIGTVSDLNSNSFASNSQMLSLVCLLRIRKHFRKCLIIESSLI